MPAAPAQTVLPRHHRLGPRIRPRARPVRRRLEAAASSKRALSGILIAALALLAALSWSGTANGATNASDAQTALERAGAFFRDRLGVDATYVWKYSVDGAVRAGEGGKVAHGIGWVQPPGTPAVGAAFLRIHEITGRPEWLDAAHGVASALVRTQLLSGGWYYKIETDPEKARDWCYRALGIDRKGCRKIESNPDRNKTVLDDNTTQSVLNFLMWFDQASGRSDPRAGEAIENGLRSLMDAQYPNGGFIAIFSDEVPGQDVPTAAKATVPDGWSREWVKPDKPPYFIVNDNLLRDTGRMFLNAYRLYGNERYREAAVRIGDFLLAAQLPAPHAGWGQIYDRSLQPVWGRKFEPPGLVSYETAGCIEYLIELYGETRQKRYMDAAAAAGEWLHAARLPNGRWARFYELNTNRPVFVDNKSRVTFSDDDLLDHYGMEGDFDVQKVLDRLREVQGGAPIVQPNLWKSEADELKPAELEGEAMRFVDGLDAEGRWTDGKWIQGDRFVRGVFVLARFIAQAGEAAR